MLGDSDRLDRVIVYFLCVLCVELYPAAVASAHRVAVVTVNIDGTAQRPVHHRHDDRQPEAGGDVKHLPHEGQPLRRSGRHSPRAGSGSPDGCAHGAVFAFHSYQFRVYLAVRYVVCEYLHNLGLRRNWVCGYHVRVYLFHCECRSLVSRKR